jgi:hypothetical protein
MDRMDRSLRARVQIRQIGIQGLLIRGRIRIRIHFPSQVMLYYTFFKKISIYSPKYRKTVMTPMTLTRKTTQCRLARM